MLPARILLPLFVLLAADGPLRAEVLVVDALSRPGSDFGDIQSAIDAAGDWDTVLIRGGPGIEYQTFTVDGKALSVVADGDDVALGGPLIADYVPTGIYVYNIAAHQEVLIRGIRTNFGVTVGGCAGSVWFDEVTVEASGSCSAGGQPGARVVTSDRVTFTGCTLRGEWANDFYLSHVTSDGLVAISSTIQLFDCEIEGSVADFEYVSPDVGGAGIRIEESTVTISGCVVRGGAGGLDGVNLFREGSFCDSPHAEGGAGIHFVGTQGVLLRTDSSIAGGMQDIGRLCPGQTTPLGPTITGIGVIVQLPGIAHRLRANSPVRGGEVLTFDVSGLAGEIPLVLVAAAHDPLPLAAQFGTLLVALPPTDVFVLSPLPASGESSLSFPVPNIGGIGDALTFYAQAIFLDATGLIWLGSGTTVVLLHPSQ